ncbi:response regulator transcription factor [Paenibacillus turpanensis]|uniref:response regulator transcription factor n=1 Tax=Paenibacillus turpanensis TaxID=2689078 RepID=UPI00140D8DAA|nr:response regulator transcription factor [Paenibacillus turpanensis]
MCKVLLVDDEMFARQGLIQFIDWKAYGFDTVLEADNGEEALELIESERPELVVTDIRMPLLDGLQLIQTVKERGLSEPVFIIVSGYNDFKYAQQAMRFGVRDFLLKPIDKGELTETLDRIMDQFRQSALFDHRGQEAKLEELLAGKADGVLSLELAAAMGITEGQELRYIVLELNDLQADEEEATMLRRYREWKQAWVRRIAEYTGHSTVLMHEQQRGVYGFLAAKPKQGDKSDWRQFIRSLQRQLALYAPGRTMVYGGSIVTSFEQVKDSFRTANEARQCKYALKGRTAVLYEETEDIAVQFIELENRFYQQLLEAMEESASEEIERMIETIFHEFQTKAFAPDAVMTSLTRCVISIVRTIQQMEGDEKQLLSLPSMLNATKQVVTLEKLRMHFSQFVTESTTYIAALRHKNSKGGIAKIKQYIEAHYRENISLKSIAAKFYMNPVYLGQLFRKSYGLYFNEFLLQFRVQEAKKLLRTSELRIYEIAGLVGFSNADYFVTQFEKVEGKTPSEYRSAIHAKP